VLIYLIRNLVNGKAYIGQTINSLFARWGNHKAKARLGSKYPIHAAIRKYGEGGFEVCVLAEAHTLDELNALEEFHIKAQKTLAPFGYNLTTGGEGNFVRSEETRDRMRKSRLGKKQPQEVKDKVAASRLGKVMPQETRDKIAAGHVGKKLSQEHIASIKAGQKRGK